MHKILTKSRQHNCYIDSRDAKSKYFFFDRKVTQKLMMLPIPYTNRSGGWKCHGMAQLKMHLNSFNESFVDVRWRQITPPPWCLKELLHLMFSLETQNILSFCQFTYHHHLRDSTKSLRPLCSFIYCLAHQLCRCQFP